MQYYEFKKFQFTTQQKRKSFLERNVDSLDKELTNKTFSSFSLKTLLSKVKKASTIDNL